MAESRRYLNSVEEVTVKRKKIIIPCILLTFLLAEVTSSSYTCHDNPYINGCTVPKGFQWYKKKFIKACDKHDICYKCGFTLKVARLKCDTAFKKNMKKTCPKLKRGIANIFKNSNMKRLECLTAAETYFVGVRTGGGLPQYWDYKTHSFCDEEWVKDCMP